MKKSLRLLILLPIVFLAGVVLLAADPADAARRSGATRSAEARSPLGVRSAILMDAGTRRVLYAQNADAAIPPASLTKILSMYVTLDQIRSKKVTLRDSVKVSRKAAGQGGSRMHLKKGEKVSLDRLLLGMAVSSGNDASVAVAEHVAGSSGRFVRLMNAKMRTLGLKRSVFKNPNGLPAKGQKTTAREMALLACSYLKKYPQALRYHKTRALRHNGVLTTNKNPLLGTCPGADGLKTGWVTASGYNIISTARRGKTRLLAVVLGAPDSSTRADEVRRLMEAGFTARGKGVSVAAVLKGSRSVQTAKAGHTVKAAQAAKAGKAVKAAPRRKHTPPRKAAASNRSSVSAKKAAGTPAVSASRAKARQTWTSSGSLSRAPEKAAPSAKAPGARASRNAGEG